jgi:hypothetical protein
MKLLLFISVALLTTIGCGSSPPAELRVVSAMGRDGATSGLAFGRSVWVYGDTVLEAPDERGEQWHTNSFGIACSARA